MLPSLNGPHFFFCMLRTFTVNGAFLYIRLDTDGFATCISDTALHWISKFCYIDRTSRSLVLTDGVIPRQVSDVVKLSVHFCEDLITFHASLAETLRIDVTLSMQSILLEAAPEIFF